MGLVEDVVLLVAVVVALVVGSWMASRPVYVEHYLGGGRK